MPQHPLTPNRLNWRWIGVAIASVAPWLEAGEATAEEPQPLLEEFRSEIQPTLDRYCYDCHGYGSDKGGVVLDGFESDRDLRDHTLWLRALKNVRTGLMPPADEAQPTAEAKEKVLDWIKRKAFQLDPERPDPGRVTLRRLNRVEYRNTIKDLLGYDYDTSVEFPADDTGHGFDNIADVLTISPMLLEKYLDAAQEIVDAVVPKSSRVVAERTLGGRDFLAEGEDVEASRSWARTLSYYEPARLEARHQVEFPGAYAVELDVLAAETYVNDEFDLNECRLVFKIDGETVLSRRFTREGWKSFQFVFEREWEAGERRFTIEVEPLTPDEPRLRNLRFQLNRLTVRGPYDERHFVKPAGYERFFPRETPESVAGREAYAREILKGFATRAYRRPIDDYALGRLVDLATYSSSQHGETFESGVAKAMVAVLASPRFLFREEAAEPEEGSDFGWIDEYALASRLSYFLWSTMPDAELFRLAEAGELREQLRPQVARMLAHPKAKAFVSNFVGQWLQARDIETVPISDLAVWLRENPDPELSQARADYRRLREIPEEQRSAEEQALYWSARERYFASFRLPKPELTGDLRVAMLKESELVFEYILQNDRSALELVDSDYTFLNEELAQHYGIAGVKGKEMRRVDLPEGSPRGGVLTQGTVLAVTSNPTRTSPVKRGVFVLDNILGTPPPPPPPNIPALEDVASEAELAEMSLRETLALHARKRACRSCHNRMDPLGLALENFNAMGIWRDMEMNQLIEPSGQLITGESFQDIRELKRIIVQDRREDFYHCLTEKLLTYALGRGLEYYDVDTMDRLVETLEASEGRLSALIYAIVESAPFQKSRLAEPGHADQIADANPLTP